MPRWIAAIAALCILLLVLFQLWERHHRLSYVPEGLNVSRIIYANEQSRGFGPGGNEAGIIVYELPDAVATEIEQVGMSYLTRLPSKSQDNHKWQGRYEKWQPTPIVAGRDWVDNATAMGAASTTSTVKVTNYLNKFGFGISIDSNIERTIDAAISQPGSYFAYGRIGILIVIPDRRRVVYAYSG